MVQKEAKKKTRAYIVSAVLLLIVLVSVVCVIGSAPLASGSQDASGSLSEKETDPNYYASLLAGKLINSFYTTLPNGTGVIIYPVEYAGAYIDHSNNLHVVLSKYATNSTIESYRNIMGNDPDIIFETAEFPLSHLYAVQDALGGVMGDFSIDAAGVNEMTNRVELNLEDSAKQKDITEYLNNQFTDFNESCITFLGPNPVTASLAEIHPSSAPNDGFLRTKTPTIYGATAIAIIAVTIAFACYLAFVRRGGKPQTTSENSGGV